MLRCLGGWVLDQSILTLGTDSSDERKERMAINTVDSGDGAEWWMSGRYGVRISPSLIGRQKR